MDTALIRKYVELRQRQKDRQAESDALRELADELEQKILDMLGEAGTDSLRISMPDGTKRTVYLHRQLWAKVPEGVDRRAICDVFQQIGMEHFVQESFNSNTVSAWLRDLEREAREEDKELSDLIPVELKGLLDATEVYKVRDRKA